MEKPFPAYEGDEPYIFVSYAHDDAGEVYPEISWLHERGIRLWYDEGISPGAEFPEELAQAIEGASLVLYYISANSVVWSLIGYLERQEQIRWVRYEAIPEIKQMLEFEWSDLTEPYDLAVQAEAILPDDPELIDLLARTSLAIDIETEPAGAEVYVKKYSEPDAPWQHLGTTPLKSQRLAVGFFRWRLEKPGLAPLEAMHSTWNLGFDGPLLQPNHLFRHLEKVTDLPEGMVRVAGGPTPFGEVPDFHIDRFEITNRQFKAFMDAGGYDNPAWWRHPFVDQGVLLDRETALAEFVDQSGRPGPATWLGGNFNRTGTVPVGSMRGLTTWGAYDMAGNVAEWCSSETAVGRVIRGGSFDDNTYEFAEASNAPPMTRQPGFGFRTALIGEGVPDAVMSTIVIARISRATGEPPVSEEVFQAYLQRFDYDHDPLNAVIEDRDTTSEQWILERVAIDAAYDGERMNANLFLPTGVDPPYQTVIYFPGSGSVFTPSSDRLQDYYEFPAFLSFLVNSGRAVAYPVYKGTFERSEERPVPLHYGSESHEYTEYMIKLVKDFRRSVDYLETRDDLDADNLAYYGMSWGGSMGSIVTAVEPRVKTSILLAAGMPAGKGVSNPVHYAPRNQIPTLMLVGRYDTILGYEDSAKPLFESLGTAPEDKKLIVYETDHIPPKRAFVTETLAWLDHYLGPVD